MDKASIIARAQQLMTNSQFWQTVDQKTPLLKGKSNEAMAYEGTGNNNSYYYEPSYNYNRQNINENLDRLPEGLRESFSKQPPIVGQSNVLDSIPDSYLSNLPSQAQIKNMVNEKKTQSNIQSQQQMNGNAQIDYNYIKYIVQECVKEALNNTENNLLKGIKLVNGGTFNFIDSKGNVYEAKLKKISK